MSGDMCVLCLLGGCEPTSMYFSLFGLASFSAVRPASRGFVGVAVETAAPFGIEEDICLANVASVGCLVRALKLEARRARSIKSSQNGVVTVI